MKVKSFVVGTVNGMESSMNRLDQLVAKLGNIEINSVTDTIIPQRVNVRTGEIFIGESIIRVIVYTPK